jgi:hypothetical protein
MKKSVLKKIAILAAPIIWRKIRGGRSRRQWHRRHHWHGGHQWHRRPRHRGHTRHGIWL